MRFSPCYFEDADSLLSVNHILENGPSFFRRSSPLITDRGGDAQIQGLSPDHTIPLLERPGGFQVFVLNWWLPGPRFPPACVPQAPVDTFTSIREATGCPRRSRRIRSS